MDEAGVIETARLRLRPWHDADAEVLYSLASHPQVGPNAGWLPHESVAESQAVIATILSGPYDYALELKETGLPVGAISLRLHRPGDTDLKPGEGEIGFWLGVPYWGQGLMPEAVRALLSLAFDQMGLTCVWCAYWRGNERSRRVQEKCGFIYHHTSPPAPTAVGMRTKVTQRMLPEDWAKVRARVR
ncbi:MAG: GNAT family N-acetyltransferase [Clostridiales bacterium]|nr:GNAT family N-acetyltransferase [Clostridiales bacterium]